MFKKKEWDIDATFCFFLAQSRKQKKELAKRWGKNVELEGEFENVRACGIIGYESGFSNTLHIQFIYAMLIICTRR